jgi:hypothetical protein
MVTLKLTFVKGHLAFGYKIPFTDKKTDSASFEL